MTKKNSQEIFYKNIRDKQTGLIKRVPFISPSEQYKNYERQAGWYINRRYININVPVNIKCLFYMPTRRRVDLTNLLEAVDDILVHVGIIEDDYYGIIAAHDGSRVFYDKDNPRTEIYITKLPAPEQLTMEGI